MPRHQPAKAADYQTPGSAEILHGMNRRLQIATVLLGVIGLLIWLGIGSGRGIGWIRWSLIAGAGVISALPPAARIFSSILDRIRNPSRRKINWATILIGFVAAIYFVCTAFAQDRDLFPKTHDDCSYAIGIQMLAHGRLWMPAVPLPEFFDNFYLLVRPVYCSLYFPGTALLYVPTVSLHLPTWLMPAMASGAVVALVYRIVTELIDGVAGALAAIIVASLSWFRVYSILLTGHIPMLLMGLMLAWAFLRWRVEYKVRWAFLIGAMAGWAAITRPADAVIFALPVGVFIVWEIFRRRQLRLLLAPIVIIAAASPFLALQLIFDAGVTGHAFRAPYTYYLEQDQPGSAFGFHAYDPAARPQSTLLQKQENYDRWVRDYLQHHTVSEAPRRWMTRYIPLIADVTLPCRLMLLFAPIGLLGMTDRRRWVLSLTFPLFLLIYALNPFFLEHYAILIIPVAIVCVLLGGHVLMTAWPRYRREIGSAFAAIIFVACLTSFWEINQFVSTPGTEVIDETFPSPYLRYVHAVVQNTVDEPAVVLFTYHPADNYFEEPVYNTDVSWPEDAPVIRAHDLGPAKNRRIIEYYAKTQPNRTFYLFDWSKRLSQDGPIRRLGNARDLANARPVN